MVDNKNEAVSTTGGNVVLDLGTILTQVANQVGIGGNLANKLPPDAAQIDDHELRPARGGADRRAHPPHPGLAPGGARDRALRVAIYLAGERRRQTLRAVGIAFLAVGVLVLFAHGLAGDYVVGALTTTAASEPAAHAAWSIGTDRARRDRAGVDRSTAS